MTKRSKPSPTLNPLDEAIRSLAPEIPGLVRRLISHRTVNPPGQGYDEMTALLAEELRGAGLQAKILTPAAKLQKAVLPPEQHAFTRRNVLGKMKVAGAGRTLHFNAHYDVVPVSGTWKHGDPFSGEVEGGWIHGRGTSDMKGSMVSLLVALHALRKAGVKPTWNLEVSFTADEETDSALGAGWLVEHAPIKPDAVVVMEGAEGDDICCGHNGVVWLEVEVHGVAAHGSRPHLGVNALEKLSALVLALEPHKKALAKRVFKAPDGTRMVPTINLGGVFGQGPGGKINTVPDLARFSIDRRVLANETVATVEKELREVLATAAAAIPQCRITVNKVSENHPCFSEPAAPIFGSFAESVRAVRGGKPAFAVSTGFTDMHFFAQHLKVPTVGYGPGGENEHAVDERARLSDIENCARIYARVMTQA